MNEILFSLVNNLVLELSKLGKLSDEFSEDKARVTRFQRLSKCYRYPTLHVRILNADFLFSLNIFLCCDHSLESSRRDDSNEWSQYRIW